MQGAAKVHSEDKGEAKETNPCGAGIVVVMM